MGPKKGKTKRFYPEEIKQEVIRMKLSGEYTNAELSEAEELKRKDFGIMTTTQSNGQK